MSTYADVKNVKRRKRPSNGTKIKTLFYDFLQLHPFCVDVIVSGTYPSQKKNKYNIKSTVFWVATQCSSMMPQRFGGTNRFHPQGRRVNQAWNQEKQAASLGSFPASFGFSHFWPWSRRRYVPPKRRTSSELQSVIKQKTASVRVKCLMH